MKDGLIEYFKEVFNLLLESTHFYLGPSFKARTLVRPSSFLRGIKEGLIEYFKKVIFDPRIIILKVGQVSK